MLALGLGALLVGAGVLLFVSAHWDRISPASRLALVLAMVAVFHVAGALTECGFPALATALHAVGTCPPAAGITSPIRSSSSSPKKWPIPRGARRGRSCGSR